MIRDLGGCGAGLCFRLREAFKRSYCESLHRMGCSSGDLDADTDCEPWDSDVEFEDWGQPASLARLVEESL